MMYFFELIPGKNGEADKIRLKGQKFEITDIEGQKKFIKGILDGFWQNCRIADRDVNDELKEIYNLCERDYQENLKWYGYVLG